MICKKDNVLNPLKLRNTVGEELIDICEAHGIDNCEELIGIKNLKNKDLLSTATLNKVARILKTENIVEYLKSFQSKYLEDKPKYLASYRSAKKTYTQLKDVRFLLGEEFCNGYDVLDDIFDFLNINSEEEISKKTEAHVALFRKQNKTSVNPVNLYAWLRRGELDFAKLTLPPYNKQKLIQWLNGGEWKLHIEDVTYFKSLPSILSSFGIGLVFVHALPKTVYGAVRWFDGKPLIQISDRGQDLASCWFTLFHEFGHTIEHRNEDIYEGEINERKSILNQREKDANKFANKYLFNGDSLRKAVFSRKYKKQKMDVNSLAEEFKVEPIFASYWLLKAQYFPQFQRRIPINFLTE